MAAPARALLELSRVSKRFPGVLANDAVDFSLHAGEVHALLGENGAGKSTLFSVLAGLQRPDGGEVRIDGAPLVLASPARARALGIAAVQQHSVLIPTLTVAENLLLGDGRGLGRPDRRAVAARFAELCREFGVAIDAAAPAGRLALGEQHLAEVVGALWHRPRVLALDEPTAMLAPDGARTLLGIMRRSTAEGAAVLFITHKLDEALAVADRITVLRHGRVAGRFGRGADREAVLAAMFGAAQAPEATALPPMRESSPASSILDARLRGYDGARAPALCVAGLSLGATLQDISFDLAAGEILGVAGIDGNGQTPLAEVLAGQCRADSGRVLLDGTDLAGRGVAARHRLGLRYVTDDRLHEGTVGAFPIAANLLLKRIGAPPFWRRGIARPRAMAAHAVAAIATFDIRAPGPWVPVGQLSGGNIQKVLLARELAGEPRVVVYNKPTHGLDALTQAATRRRIAAQAASGVACLLISPDLDELFSLAHRIVVMRGGRMLGPLANGVGARHAAAALMAGTP